MTVLANEEELIGSLIPDVYIKTITLETAGTVIRETNPHIEHARETISASPPTNNNLSATLDLLLKEEFSNDLIGSWFSDQDFQKYLRFTVIQSSHPLVTKILSAANNAIQIVNMNSADETAVFAAELMAELKDLPEFSTFAGVTAAYSEEDIPEIMELIEQNTKTKYVSVKEFMLNNNSMLNQKTQSVTDSGHRIFDFTFRLKFDIPTSKPQHLSYFAVSSIDIDQIISDYNLDKTDTHLLELMNGKTVLDNVIANGSLVSKSFVFRDQDGLIWSGPVHKESGMWLTGSPESLSKSPLTRAEIENGKIQDFRNYDDLERLQLNFSVVENTSFNSNLPFQRLTNDNMDVPRAKSYFSDVALSRDSQGACRFIFGLDYGKMVKENTKYGALYNKNNLQRMFDNVRIRNFSVLRRRVTRAATTLNQLGSPVEKTEIFNQDEAVDIICHSGESTPGKMKLGTEINGVVREVSLASHSDISEVRHFTGIDHSMPLVTDGYYQYGVEIEIEDRTDKLILDKINDLAKAKYWLDHYYNLSILPAHFDLLGNKFTEEFIDQMYSQYGWKAGGKPLITSPWIAPVTSYLETLSFFRKKPVNMKLATSLWKYTDPKTGNPRGIAMIQKLIENLAQRLASVIGVNISEKRPPNLSPDGDGNYVMPAAILSPGKPPLKTFKLEYYFHQVFDSNLPKAVGYDYLSKGPLEKEPSRHGLRTISSADYRQRTELESLKFFNDLNSDISMRASNSVSYTEGDTLSSTSLTYLSPSNVNLAVRGNYSMLDNPFDPEKALKIQSAITAINLAKKSPFMPVLSPSQQNPNASSQMDQGQLDIKSNMTSVMSIFGCTTAAPVSSPFQNFPQLLDLDYDPYADAEELMGLAYSNVDQSKRPATDEIKNNELETKTNPVSLFVNLAFPMFMSGKGMSNLFTNYNLADSMSKPAKRLLLNSFNINFYKLTNTSGSPSAIETATSALATATELPTTTVGNNAVNASMMSQMLNLPNQVKSLFLSDTAGATVKYNWLANDGLPTLTKAAFILNYKTLRRTEVFVGYGRDSEGQPMLKNPIWEPLTEKLLDKASDNNLLCRTVKYENKTFGCVEAIGMRLPVYNKYFVIGGDSSVTKPAPKPYLNKLKVSFNRVLKQHQHLRPEFLSTGIIPSKLVTPTASTKLKVAEKVDLTKNIKLDTKVK